MDRKDEWIAHPQGWVRAERNHAPHGTLPAMKRIACIALLALGACDEDTTGRSDFVRFVRVEGQTQPLPHHIDAAEDIVGLDFDTEPSTPLAGGIAVFYDPYVRNASGYAVGATCTPYIVVHPQANERTFAHEVGHALGLAHNDRPNNLMNPAAPGEEIDDDQVDTMRTWAWILENDCAPVSEE